MRATRCLLFPLLLLLLQGCAGYRLGSMLPRDIRTVYIPVVQNSTTEPLLETEVTQAVVRQIQQDGSLRITSEANADSVLRITITRYEANAVVYTSAERAEPDEYRLIIRARIELLRSSDGATLARSQDTKGERLFPFTGDMASARLDALPDAADDLARDIIEKITEAWP